MPRPMNCSPPINNCSTRLPAATGKPISQLCDPTLTAFEPEAQGQLVEGLDFHKFYFDLGADPGPRHTTMASPHVRLMGDTALVAYVRLVQSLDAAGHPRVSRHEETRIWQRREGRWRHVHFHRSTS